MKKYLFPLILFGVLLLQNSRLGARYSSGGIELVKFMTLKNDYCRTEVFQEYNKYDEMNKYLKAAFRVYPSFLQERTGLRLKEEPFFDRKKDLQILIVSDKTLNTRIIGQYGLLLPVEGLYDSMKKTIYISKDYDMRTLVHEYFHFLRDISGVAMDREREESLADQFSELIVDNVGEKWGKSALTASLD